MSYDFGPITQTRKVSGRLYAYQVYTHDLGDTQRWGGGCAAAIDMDFASLSIGWHAHVEGDPDSYNIYDAYLYCSASGSGGFSIDELIYQFRDFASGGYVGIAPQVADFTKYIDYSVEVVATFNKKGRYWHEQTDSEGQDLYDDSKGQIWSNYGSEHTPVGLPEQKFEIYYVPTGANVTISAAGQTVTFSVAAEDIDPVKYRYGLGGVSVTLSNSAISHTYSGSGYWAFGSMRSMKLFGNALIEGIDCPTPDAMNWYDENDVQYLSASVSDGTFTISSIGATPTYSNTTGANPVIFDIDAGPYTISYSGYCGGMLSPSYPTERCQLQCAEGHNNTETPPVWTPRTGYTDSQGIATLSESYEGKWSFGLGDVNDQVVNDLGKYASAANNCRTHGMHGTPLDEGGLINLDTVKQPRIPFESINSSIGASWQGFSNRRVDLFVPGLLWEDALTLSVASSKLAYTFLGSESAEWTASTGITLSSSGSSLLATVAGDATGTLEISRTVDVQCAGARRVAIDYTASDSGEITLEMAGRQYGVTPTADTIDVLKPTNHSGDGTTQTAGGADNPAWDWGLHQIGTLKITGLRPGNTYVFNTLTLLRAAQPEPIEVFIEPEFVGVFSGDSRSCDGRIGYIIVDGVVGAELYGVHHEQVAGVWAHTAIALSSADFMKPSDGLISKSIAAGVETWQTGDQAAAYLLPGHYTSSEASITLDWRGKATQMLVPLIGGDTGFSFKKHLMGLVGIRTLNSTAENNATTVTIREYERDGGTELRNWTTTTDVNGWVRTSELQPPYCVRGIITAVGAGTITVSGLDRDCTGYTIVVPQYDSGTGWHDPVLTTVTDDNNGVLTLAASLSYDDIIDMECAVSVPYYYTVEVIDKDNNVISGGLQLRNNVTSFIALLAALPASAKSTDIDIDQFTGIGHVAYTNNGGLYVQRTFDHGATFYPPVLVTDENNPESPCLFHTNDALRNEYLLWCEGTTLKLAKTGNAFVSQEVSTLMTGVKHPRGLISPWGIMLVAGWRQSDGKIVVAQSFDNGATIGTAVVVATVPEQSFGLAFAPTARNTWCITCADDTGTVKTYWSTDNGASWSLAS